MSEGSPPKPPEFCCASGSISSTYTESALRATPTTRHRQRCCRKPASASKASCAIASSSEEHGATPCSMGSAVEALGQPRLAGDGVVLRPFANTDAAVVIEAGRDPLIPSITTVRARGDRADALDYVRTQHSRAATGSGGLTQLPTRRQTARSGRWLAAPRHRARSCLGHRGHRPRIVDRDIGRRPDHPRNEVHSIAFRLTRRGARLLEDHPARDQRRSPCLTGRPYRSRGRGRTVGVEARHGRHRHGPTQR